MKCAKCANDFVENRTVWPSNICGACRSSIFTCTANILETTGRLPRAKKNKLAIGHKKDTAIEVKLKPTKCGAQVKGSSLDPSEHKGLEWCVNCRKRNCHICGKISAISMYTTRCSKCRANKTVCEKCRDKSCTIGIPASEKIPPSCFDAIQYTPLVSTIIPCSNAQKKPLLGGSGLGGSGTHVLIPAATLSDSFRYAHDCFNNLVQLLCRNPHIGTRRDAPLPNSQDTMAISLLEDSTCYRIILTYSEYDLTHVPNSVKTQSAALKDLVIDANPKLEYDKIGQRHFIFTSSGKIPYALHSQNQHHAEMRAYTFARDNGYFIHCIIPTKECCSKCQTSLGSVNELGKVPHWLQTQNAPSRWVDEGNNQLVDEANNATYTIQPVTADGNCLFHALWAIGLRCGAAQDALTLRTAIADALALPPGDALRVPNQPVDTTQLGAIAGVLGGQIILYEGHYGETEWTHCTVHGNGNPIAVLFLRSIRGQGEGHYDWLS